MVEPDQVEEVPELHEEVPEEDPDAERAEHPVRRDRTVPVDRVLEARRDAFGPLLGETAAVPFGKAAVHDEGHEADHESDRLGADEVLGVNQRSDPRADRAAQDLSDEHGSREERKEPLRLPGVVEVSRIDPEQDVDRLFHAVREDIGDRLHDPAIVELPLDPDAALDRDRQDRHPGDVPEEKSAAANAVDEEEDHRRDSEHRDRRDDVHDRHVVHAPPLHEERVRAELADPVGRHHERQQGVEEETETPLATPKRKCIAEDAAEHSGYFPAAARSAAGNVNWMIAPLSPGLTTLMVPPWSSTASLQKARPRPVPPRLSPAP